MPHRLIHHCLRGNRCPNNVDRSIVDHTCDLRAHFGRVLAGCPEILGIYIIYIVIYNILYSNIALKFIQRNSLFGKYNFYDVIISVVRVKQFKRSVYYVIYCITNVLFYFIAGFVSFDSHTFFFARTRNNNIICAVRKTIIYR